MVIRDFESQAKQIVTAARGYLGVPFAHQGRSRPPPSRRGGCCCCAMMARRGI